jgi:hypothetical protein
MTRLENSSRFFFLSLMLMTFANATRAAEPEAPIPTSQLFPPEQLRAVQLPNGLHFHKRESVYMASTYVGYNRSTGSRSGFDLGASYEFRPAYFRSHLGFGLGIDRIFATEPVTLVIATAAWLPIPWLRLNLGPGWQRSLGVNSWLVRAGLGVELTFHSLAFIPNFQIDFMPDRIARVIGMSVGARF